MGTAGTGGARVAELRKERGITQVALARRAGISVSLLSKIEIGDRTLTPGIAAAIARILQISLGALYGEAEVSGEQSVLLEDLRTAVRRYDIPDQAPRQTPPSCAWIWTRSPPWCSKPTWRDRYARCLAC